MFISFEGLDGCGKTTQINLLAEKLASLAYDVVFIREPGGTVISERIRDILLDTKHQGMNQITELLLFSAARAQLVNEVIKPALAESKMVLCDRYVDSTTAYQGYGRGLRLGAVKTINAVATLGVMPQLTFIIDLPLEELERRKKRSGANADRSDRGISRWRRPSLSASRSSMARRRSARLTIGSGRSFRSIFPANSPRVCGVTPSR
jgi:dTMP kinase